MYKETINRTETAVAYNLSGVITLIPECHIF